MARKNLIILLQSKMFESTSIFLIVLTICVGCLVLLLCVMQFRESKRKHLRYPPGPFSIPFVGPIHWGMFNVFQYGCLMYDVWMLFSGDDRYKIFVKWTLRYKSDVVSFSLAPGKRIVVLNSYSVMRDALQGATSGIFAGRPINFGKITQPAADNIGK